jgi:undecaprenyl-diphosphatase
MLDYWDALVLGIVEGLTEYLPVSSTGHLTVAEKMLGLPIDAPAVTGYTATIQIGAILATLVYFRRTILRLVLAWFAGVRSAPARADHDYTLAWAVIVGSIPLGIVGFLARDLISGPLRSLWVVAAALVVWSGVMWVAEARYGRTVAAGQVRGEADLTVLDGVKLGLVQCFSLIPGVSRSGATISAGIGLGINRKVATEVSFFLAIPALVAAGLFGLRDVDFAVVPLGPMIVGIVVSFLVAYVSIAWLLRFVASNSLRPFIYYRVPAGILLAVAVGLGWIQAA